VVAPAWNGRIGSIASCLCKKRKDGAPEISLMEERSKALKGWATRRLWVALHFKT
jgi:hypothetical protein